MAERLMLPVVLVALLTVAGPFQPLLALEQTDESVEFLRRTVALNPESPRAWAHLVDALASTQRDKEASRLL
jgi:hypothetical protein